MFLPMVIPSILKTFLIYFSKVEAVSASVQDSKTTLTTKQAKFLNKQFSYNRLSFQFIWIQKLNWIRHFFSLVSTCYSCRVSYDANKF